MNNKEYAKLLGKRVKVLTDLRKQGISISAGIIGKTLLKEDFYFCASVDRCLNLIDGIASMLSNRNLTCAGAILRLQMDNCIRTYAAFIAEDKDKVVDCIISGDTISGQKSKDGKRLKDGYLKCEISKIDNEFAEIYDKGSGFIHLSDKAFYQTIVNCEGDHIDFQIGHELPDKRNPVLIEIADAFVHFVKLHYKMLEAVADSKKRFDLEMEDKEKVF